MAVTDSFKKAVSGGDVMSLRIMIKDSLLRDPTFAKFDEMTAYAKGVNGLYDDDGGYKPAKERDGWNEEYMLGLMVEVIDDFSRARLSHLKDVVRHLRPMSASSSASSRAGASSAGSRQNTHDGKVKAGAVGAGVGVVASVLFGGTILSVVVSAIVGAVAGVAVGAFVTNERSSS
jgi:hypothetical protein